MYDPEDLFIMGVGNAYLGVKVLLLNRGNLRSFLNGRHALMIPSRLQVQD